LITATLDALDPTLLSLVGTIVRLVIMTSSFGTLHAEATS